MAFCIRKRTLMLLLLTLVVMMWLESSVQKHEGEDGVITAETVQNKSSIRGTSPHPPPQHLTFAIREEERLKPTFSSYTGQPWLRNNTALCSLDQIRDGRWEKHYGKAQYATTITHLRCHPYDSFFDETSVNYHWRPKDHSCEWVYTFSNNTFCDLMQGSALLIAGDSLSWEHFRSLMHLNGRHVHQGFQHQSLEFDTNIILDVCGGRVKVAYRRDDQLQKVREALHQEPFPTVVVLNRGAHYANNTDLLNGVDDVLEALGEWKERCRELNVECQAIWRTTVPGTPHCDQFDKPVNDRSKMEAWIANRSNYDEKTIRYHWYNYQPQNLLVAEKLRQSDVEVHLLDAYASNVLRPDDHRAHQNDCLHNCYPGKMDIYNSWMLHILRQTHTVATVLKQAYLAGRVGTLNVPETEYDKEGWEKLRENLAKYGCRYPPCE